MNVIAVANQKGGVGKTTTALSLGAALTRMGKKVLFVDLDPHVCASIHLRYYPEEQSHTIYELFTTDVEELPAVWSRIILHRENQGWSIVSGDTRLADIEILLQQYKKKGYILQNAFSQLSETYDFIILDCPPQSGVLLVNAIVASDLLIIPIQTDFLALHGLKLLFDTLRILNKGLGKQVRYRTLATMYDKRTKACRNILQLLQTKMKNAMFSTIVPIDTRFREASASGCVIFDHAPFCQGAIAYEALAEEVMNLW